MRELLRGGLFPLMNDVTVRAWQVFRSAPNKEQHCTEDISVSSKHDKRAIRERAYFIWEREGCPKGRDIANWLEAEAAIEQEYNDVGGLLRSWAEALADVQRTQSR